MPWFRAEEGISTDVKYQLIARRSGQPVERVMAVWLHCLDKASGNPCRGSIDNLDTEVFANFLGCEPEDIEAILGGLAAEGVLQGEAIRGWRKYALPPRPSPSIWARLRRAVFERDGYTCVYCGRIDRPLECDHVLAVANGGSHAIDNLTTSCRPCNRSKRDRPIAEWLGGRA